MKLYFQKSGTGKPLLILHGMFGLGDNWATLGKEYAAKGFAVYLVDLRNHGRSPHSDELSYELMADDILQLLNDEKIEQANFIGHSMGGKVLMFFSEKYASRIERMIIADMAPRYYAPHHQSVFAALHTIDFNAVHSRKEAEALLRNSLREESTIQFLLKNLFWKDDTHLDWRFNLKGIENNIGEIGKAFQPVKPVNVPVWFIRGGNSGYINDSDEKEIKLIFPRAKIETISEAGHWIHAEKPKEFLEKTLQYLN